MLKLKLQYFGHLIQRADSLEKTLILGKTEGRRRRGQQSEQTPGDSKGQRNLAWDCKQLHMTECLNNNKAPEESQR